MNGIELYDIDFVETKVPNRPALNFVQGETTLPLHSRYNPVVEADKLVDAAADAELYILVGIGAGHVVRSLCERKNALRILCIEPLSKISNIETTQGLLLEYRRKLHIVYTDNDESVYHAIVAFYFPQFFRTVSILITPGYVGLSKFLRIDPITAATKGIAEKQTDFITQAHMGRVWLSNIVKNLKTLIGRTQAFVERRGTRLAVFGAGPGLESLSKTANVFSNQFTVIADATVNWFSQHGLTPNAILSFDGQNISYMHIVGEIPAETTTHLIDLCSHPSYARLNRNIFAMRSAHPFLAYLDAQGLELPHLNTSGGNVGHAMVDWGLRHAKASEIDVYGIDFAYIDGRPYARPGFMQKQSLFRASRLKTAEQFLTDLYVGIHHTRSEIEGVTVVTTDRFGAYRRAFLSGGETSERGEVHLHGPTWQPPHKMKWRLDHESTKQDTSDLTFSAGLIDRMLGEYCDELGRLEKNFRDPLECFETGSDTEKRLITTLLPIMAWCISFLLKQNPSITDIRCEGFAMACRLSAETIHRFYGSKA